MAKATIEISDGENGGIKIRVLTGAVGERLSRAQCLAMGLCEEARKAGVPVEVAPVGLTSLGKVSRN